MFKNKIFNIFILLILALSLPLVLSGCRKNDASDVPSAEETDIPDISLPVLNYLWYADIFDGFTVDGSGLVGASTESEMVPPSVVIPDIQEYKLPDFITDHTFVYDITNEEYLYMSGYDDKIYPASTIKLLTVMYAKTILPLDFEVIPGAELSLVHAHSSLAQINSNHVLTVEQLIKGMLLASGNDAAYALAAACGRKLDPNVKTAKEAVDTFLKGMNEYAVKLGLSGSNFLTPDGYQVEGNYSTVEDMSIVARLAYRDELIRSICIIPQEKVVFASGHHITWKNSNMGVRPDSKYYNPYINGLKTGMASSDYYCNIVSCNINGREFVFGFFGETNLADRYNDAHIAIKWVMENFK